MAEGLDPFSVLIDATLAVLDKLDEFNRAFRHWDYLVKHPEYAEAGLGTAADAWQELLACYDSLQVAVQKIGPVIAAGGAYLLGGAHRGSTVSSHEAPGIEATCWPHWVLQCAMSVVNPAGFGVMRSEGPRIDRSTMYARLNSEAMEALRLKCEQKHRATKSAAELELASSTSESGRSPTKITLDERGLAIFIKHRCTKAEIARRLRVPRQSLSQDRCPQLHAAIKAWKAHKVPGKTTGPRFRRNNKEVWDEEQDRLVDEVEDDT